MDNKEVLTTKERVLLVIQAICLMIFLAWLDIASNFDEIGPATIIILSVSGGVFLIAFIIYIIPVMKARKAIKANFFNSIHTCEPIPSNELDKEPLVEQNQNVIDSDSKDEGK